MAERLNENAYLNFPFLEDQSLLTDTGEPIPSSLLLDFSAAIFVEATESVKLASLVVDPAGAGLTAHFTIVTADATFGKTIYVPVGVSEFVTARDVDQYVWSALATFGEGVNEFCAAYPNMVFEMELELEPSRISHTFGHAVRSVSAVGGAVLTGDVKFMEGDNFSISVIKGTDTLSLSAQKGAGAGLPCGGEDDGNCGDLLYDVNGLSPDWYGNFKLQGGPGISITPDPANNKLVIGTNVSACKAGCPDV